MATESSMGFKDKEKALDTLQHLEGRDPEYQRLAIKGLIGRAKRTLQGIIHKKQYMLFIKRTF